MAIQKTDRPPSGATPDNTPVPGGGRWRWDYTRCGWISGEAPPPTESAAPAETPATEPNPE